MGNWNEQKKDAGADARAEQARSREQIEADQRRKIAEDRRRDEQRKKEASKQSDVSKPETATEGDRNKQKKDAGAELGRSQEQSEADQRLKIAEDRRREAASCQDQ